MAKVTYDDRSFMVDGERIWLVSGSVHYFRVPAELWRDRLLKAKRAGLNCISTYVAWNFHESQEGKWDFSGDRDVCGFVELAKELGLYVILRPGPYICAEWDFGGLPAWLTTKTGMGYRSSNAAFTHYYDKYFRRILPHLAAQQVTRGGNIILIQNENAYTMTTMPDRLAYLEFINQLFRRAGFDVPIINCNYLTEPPVPDNVACSNFRDRGVQNLKQLRLHQRKAPLLVTEFRAGWPDSWGQKHGTIAPAETARRAMEILGCGAQCNYYMWGGGTNFAFWGGRLASSDTSYQAASYDYDAPLAEGGALTEKYYLTKLVNMLANFMGRTLAGAAMEAPGVHCHDGISVLNLAGSAGRWAVVTNNGCDEIDSARVSLPNGLELDVSLEPFGAAAIPVSVALSDSHKLDYCNLTPLGFFDEKILVVHGPADWEGRISVNGREICVDVPSSDEPKMLDHQGLSVVVVNSDLATRTWRVAETLVFGAEFVGEDLDEVVLRKGAKQYWQLTGDEKPVRKKPKAAAATSSAVPRLGPWKRVAVCTEPVSRTLDWKSITKPTDVDHLGVHYGYVWYRIEVDEKVARTRHLFLPDCADRAMVYLNGSLLGVWGRGSGAARSPMSARFRKGRNVLAILVDNLGRFCAGPRLGELKGLYGHIHDAQPLRNVKFKLKASEGFPRRIVPRHLMHLVGELEGKPVWVAETDIRLTKVAPIHVSFTGIGHHAAVLCNDRTAGFFPCGASGGVNFGDVTLGAELKRGKNILRLLLWGDVPAKVLQNVKLHVLGESVTQGAVWSYRQWAPPKAGGPVVGKGQPAWYVAKFKCRDFSQPLFLNIHGAKKGQIFLNAHNVGRFWNVGPQERYYLPSCWLAAANELLVFEEAGHIPANSRLEFKPHGP